MRKVEFLYVSITPSGPVSVYRIDGVIVEVQGSWVDDNTVEPKMPG